MEAIGLALAKRKSVYDVRDCVAVDLDALQLNDASMGALMGA